VISLLASQLAGNLAWITVCAEDAPDLIASSPMDGAFIRRAKLLAALLPTLALAATPLLALAVLSPAAGAVGAAATAVSCVCAGLINLWYEKPAPRKGLRARRQGQVVVALAELIVSGGWSVTAVLALRSPLWALVPGVLTLMVLGALKVLAEPGR
jgi:ABC-2 type transport system permease protein